MSLKYYIKIIIFFALFFTDYVKSDNIALPCYGCHANNENSIPKIDGLSYEYFIKSFNEYKNNEREHYIMRIIAKGYTEKEIKKLAKYFEKKNEN